MARRLIPLAAVLGMAFGPASALASRMTATAEAVNGSASFQLRNDSASEVAERALALINPAGSIVPTNQDVSPVTILPGSSGFDQDNLRVFLFDGDPGQTGQEGTGVALGLEFAGGGLAPGGVLNFAVSLLPGFQGPLTLDLIFGPDATSESVSFGDGPPVPVPVPSVPSVPEPISVVLWSSLAGLGLIRAHAFRRSHAPRG